jgi:DNA repair protein RecO (recombination protein O)
VSGEAGAAWRDRLLRLPAFLRDEQAGAPSAAEVLDGFALTGRFLERHVLEPRGLAMSETRQQFLAALDPLLPAAG